MISKKIILGCIADDFTGASDAASFLAAGGMKIALYNGIPTKEDIVENGCQGIVIALKTRTANKVEAVTESMEACRWLETVGVKQIYVKYCSTFDSTKEGNIGPVVDSIMEKYEIPYTLLCPSLPVNQRVVKDGQLFVNGILLHESSMKNHPLTPMWSSEIKHLIEAQSQYEAITINIKELYGNKERLLTNINTIANKKKHIYVIPDYYEEMHGNRIIEVFGDLPFLTGASGLLPVIAKRCLKDQKNVEPLLKSTFTKGGAVLLAGSCSTTTLLQIAEYQKKGGKSYQIHPMQLLEGKQTLKDILDIMRREDNLLIYSSAPVNEVKEIQLKGKDAVANLLEQIMAEIAAYAIDEGKTRIIVAGGETSGAVMKKLGFKSYLIGESIAPGVPVMIPLENKQVRLVLKSGNFGQPNFFERALKMTGES